jgi:ABC-type tungstate transport system substrate-binding protein
MTTAIALETSKGNIALALARHDPCHCAFVTVALMALEGRHHFAYLEQPRS